MDLEKLYLEEYRNKLNTPTGVQMDESEFVIDKSLTLTKDDLKSEKYINPIRDYMIARKGVDYNDMEEENVVDDFVEHMRWFNANSVSTSGEVRFVGKADEANKTKARKAYQIYDQLGNVFVNDGAMGAVGGVWDYITAAAVDPTNYLGLMTGGTARFAAAGVTAAGKATVKELVKKAGKEALESGATKEAAQKAAKEAGILATNKALSKGYTKQQAKKIAARVESKVADQGPKAIASRAERDFLTGRKGDFAKKSLYATTALDASAAVLNDVMIQNAYLEVNAQESYSATQTMFSSFLGGIGGAAQLGFGKFSGTSGLTNTTDPLEKVTNDVIKKSSPFMEAKSAKKASKSVVDSVNTWAEKVARGETFEDEGGVTAQLVKHIIIGEDGKGGVGKVVKDMGYKVDRNLKTTDFITNVVRFMPQEDLQAANKLITKYTNIKLGELDEVGINLSDLIAYDTSDAAKKLNVMSQLRKTLDASIVASSDALEATMKNVEENTTASEKKEYLKYTQGVWKRLLVSSPSTTALNVVGYGTFAAGQTLADIFNAGLYGARGVAQIAIDPKAAKQSFQRMSALTALQGQKMRNLFDPYTTRDAYLELLEENPDIKKALFETMAGGVEQNAVRHGIDPKNPVYKGVEAIANAANTITGVRVQDTFTKSQMFMSEIDKAVRLKHNKTFREVLASGDSQLLDDEVMGAALDTTLKSVYSKDYTAKNQPELTRSLAKAVEVVSNAPGLGTILPFGRFFNNVIGTAYQWSPLAAPELLVKFMAKTGKKALGKDVSSTLTEQEAWSRMLVGMTALGAAVSFDEERRKKGLAYNEIDVGGGTIVDAKNTYPFSAFLAAGRIVNMRIRGEDVPGELLQEMGTQLAVGQLARDAQFGNDINNIMDILFNEDPSARAANAKGIAKIAGNFTAGFTRPLDAVNKTVGFAMGTDTAKDVRQADSLFETFSLSASKYIDNIFEMFDDKIDGITGEELRVATREGDVYDANPFARIFGLTIKPGRTATEKAYSMAEMFPWEASERTKVAGYDRAFNTMIAPVLEKKAQRLLRRKEFKEGSLTQKRETLRRMVSDTKGEYRKYMKAGGTGAENAKLALVMTAEKKTSKEVRREAKRLLKEKRGVEVSDPLDMSYQELALYVEYIDYLDGIYDALSKM